MKAFTATLGTETNSFSPIPTGMSGFEQVMLWRPGEHPDFPTEVTGPLWALREKAAKSGWEVVEGTCAFAMPAGPTSKEAYEALRDEVLGQLREAMPVDMVALGLHGAMMAHGYPDCEGDILHRVRDLVGDDVVVGAELDPHCHLTRQMLDQSDFLVLFRENPHTDYVDRGRELVRLMERRMKNECSPVYSVFDCRMLAGFLTTRDPMKSFLGRIREMETADEVLSISIVHGFSMGDHPDVGARVLVYTDNEQALADEIADTLGRELFSMRDSFRSVQQSVDEVIAGIQRSKDFPIVLADVSDTPGGGAPGDSTEILRILLERGAEDVCLGPLWDPMAVDFCFQAGPGARFPLRFGGKACPDSGPPVDAEVEVVCLQENATQTAGGQPWPLGRGAAVRIGSIFVVIAERRDQAYHPDLFENMGLDPRSSRLIVVKSGGQFRTHFEPIAAQIVHLRTSEPLKRDAYRNLTRPLWPFDEDPFGGV